MKMTPQGLELIKSFEGLSLRAYLCPANRMTIGYGHTNAAGPPKVTIGMKITKEEAEAILLRDLKKYEDAVRKAVKVDLNDSQFSALVSFCYNVGPSAFNKSSVLEVVNKKRFDLVPTRLALWNKGDGRVLPGLVRRRAAEADLFVSQDNDEKVHFSTEVTPSKGKPLKQSKTAYAAIAVGAASVVSTTADVSTNLNTIKDNVGPTVFFGGILAVVLIGLGYIIYDRYVKSRDDGV